MLAEFNWENKTFLGILVQSHEKTKTTNKTFPKLIELFGVESLPLGYESDQEWLENLLTEKNDAKGFIWYPVSFESPIKNQYESVHIFTNPNFKIMTLDEKDEIKFHKPKGLKSFGFEIFPKAITSFHHLHSLILSKLQTNSTSHKSINKRNIFYLDQLTNLNFDQLQEKITFDPLIFFKMKSYLKTDSLQLWNAFVSIVPPGLLCPDQVVHRDCLYDSISLFFYLEEPCQPGTEFFPFTHRLLQGIKENCSQGIIPILKPLDIIMMDGKLYHHGIGGLSTSKRILYVFQYRDNNQKRNQRCLKLKFIENLISNFSDSFPTTFKIR